VIGGYGKYVCVQHTQTLSTCYAHNSRLRVTEGERVHHGDVIARSGCTGRCYGAPIHFEVRANGRPVNPRPYL
jgi:peptidoglycan DL-endopeptidase CwlO